MTINGNTNAANVGNVQLRLVQSTSSGHPVVRPNRPRMLTVQDISRALNISKMTVYRMISLGELEAYRFGRNIRVPEKSVHDWVARSRVTPVEGDS